MSMNQKQKEKGADLLLDIIKYIVTAVVISALFSDFSQWEWYWYVLVTVVGIILTTIDLSFYKDDSKKKGK